jgi:hypothetical protein
MLQNKFLLALPFDHEPDKDLSALRSPVPLVLVQAGRSWIEIKSFIILATQLIK